MNKIVRNLFAVLTLAVVALSASCKLSVNIKTQEEESKLVKINPVIAVSGARTALPVFEKNQTDDDGYYVTDDDGNYVKVPLTEAEILANLSSIYLYYGPDKENCEKGGSFGSYSTYEGFTNQEFLIPEGTYCFKFSANYNGNSCDKLTGILENVTISSTGENTLNFEITPDTSSYYNSYPFKFTFYFPEDTHPSYRSCRVNRYNLDGTIYTTDSSVSKNSNFDEENNSITVTIYSYNNDKYNYTFDFVFYDYAYDNEAEELTDEVVGIFEYSTAARPANNLTVKEEYTVEEFFPAYKLTYHVKDVVSGTETDHSNDVILYYSAASGFDLYNAQSYTWFTDADCTIPAHSAASCTATGNKDFYRDSNKNYKTLTVKDMDDNVVGERQITNDYYYRLFKDQYFYTQNSGSTYLNKDGYYISGFYTDRNKTEKLKYYDDNTSNYYYLTEDTVIYADYKEPYTLTVKEYGTDTVIGEVSIENDFYYLDVDYMKSFLSSYSYPFVIAKYYADENTVQPLALNEEIPAEGNTVIYAVKAKSEVLTLDYNRAYKLGITGSNAEIVKAYGWATDYNNNDKWSSTSAFNSSYTRSSNYTRTVYYGPVDPSMDFSATIQAVEVVSEEAAIYPDIAHKDSENTVINNSDALWDTYSYNLLQGTKYNIYFSDSTDCMFYLVDSSTGKLIVSIDYGEDSFVAPSTGKYDVYIGSYNDKTRVLDCRFHIYEDEYTEPVISVKTYGDISINSTEPDEETGIITLSTEHEFTSYTWKMGNTVLGYDSTYEFNPADYIAGEGYHIVLTCDGGLTTTIVIKLPKQEDSNEE